MTVAVSAEQLARELRAFDGRRAVVQAARRGITRALPSVRKAVKAHALEILPASGGLGAWVAAARLAVKISYASRSAGIKLRGSRKSIADKSDLAGIDAGRVRAPSWGHRTAASWHSQSVPAGWWSTPVAADVGFRDHVDRTVDEALEVIRRG
jgi:hypothetical protein